MKKLSNFFKDNENGMIEGQWWWSNGQHISLGTGRSAVQILVLAGWFARKNVDDTIIFKQYVSPCE